MGQGDEYSRDAYNYELAYDSDESDEMDYEMHPEDWQDMYSQEILDGWMVIRGYTAEHYMQIQGTFHDFMNLALAPQEWYTRNPPQAVWRTLWNMLKDFPIISERIQEANFYAWSEKYIGYF